MIDRPIYRCAAATAERDNHVSKIRDYQGSTEAVIHTIGVNPDGSRCVVCLCHLNCDFNAVIACVSYRNGLGIVEENGRSTECLERFYEKEVKLN